MKRPQPTIYRIETSNGDGGTNVNLTRNEGEIPGLVALLAEHGWRDAQITVRIDGVWQAYPKENNPNAL
jgi:hypothetical protein